MNALQNFIKINFFGLLIVLFLLPSTNAEAQIIRTYHDSKVSQFAYSAAKKLQESICPISGRGVSAYVNQWVYDEYQKHYEIHLNATWTGRTWAFGDDQHFSVSGILTVSEDGRRSNFNQTYANDAVSAANTNNGLATGAAILGVLIVAESQN